MPASLTCISAGGGSVRAPLLSFLTPELRDSARSETNRWIKSLRLVRYGDQTMRQRFTYRDDSLWWFTELYLQKMRRLDGAVASVLGLEAAVATCAPAKLVIDEADDVVSEVAAAFARRHQIAIEVHHGAPAPRARWSGYLVGLTARLSRLRPRVHPAVTHSPAVAAFVHTAFWTGKGDALDPRHEQYIGSVLDAVAHSVGKDDLFFVGVGPRRNFRARRWWDPMTPPATQSAIVPVEQLAPRGALEGALALWRNRNELAREVTTGDAIRAAAEFHGCDLWPVLRHELEGAATVQWPWSARAMDEAAAALDALRPPVVLTYAEAGGWGRALTLEARRRRIHSVGLQHGFIYRHWLNYLHEPDELTPAGADLGCPIPDRTLVFDRYAASFLTTAGHYPEGRVTVTGNPRLDDLQRAVIGITDADRARLRETLASKPVDRIALLAAKFSEIAEHLPALGAAVDGLPNVTLVIKPHPAETAGVYSLITGGRSRVVIAPSGLSLAQLLSACDALVTMNSTVAIDGLSLGVPSLVVGLPNNLSPFVSAGVMLGSDAPERVRPALEALLYDRDVRDGLLRRAQAFLDQHDMRPKGDAAARSAAEIVALARR